MTRRRRSAGALTALLAVITVAAVTLGLPAQAVTAPGPAAAGAPALAAVPRPTTTPTGLPVDMAVTQVTPQVLQPGQDLLVSVTLTNTGTEPVTEPRVILHLNRSPMTTRTALDRWRTAGTGGDPGIGLVHGDLEAPLAPGASAVVHMTLAADAVGLGVSPAGWGPRGLALELVDLTDPIRPRLGTARTFLLWFPEQDVTSTRVSVLVPLVGPAVSPHDTAWVADLEELTGADGRLADALAATEGTRGVTWVVDPWLVDATDSTGWDGTPPTDDEEGPDAPEGTGEVPDTDGAVLAPGAPEAGVDDGAPEDSTVAGVVPGPPGTRPEAPASALAGAAARAWGARMLSATVDRDVQLLPYLDPDLGALAHADASEALADARARADALAATTDLPDSASTALAWPAASLPDLATVAFAAADAGHAVVVGPGELPPPRVLTYTPSGRSTATTPGGDVPLLVPDARLSTALVTGAVPDGEPPASGTAGTPDGVTAGGTTRPDATPAPSPLVPTTTVTPATAAQDVLAELAVITLERPNDARHLLLTTPRDWDPRPDVAAAQLTALETAPWVRTEPVAALVGQPTTGVDRGTLPRRKTDTEEITPAEVAAVQEAVTERVAAARMAEDPVALVGDTGLELLAPLSVAWRADPVGRSALVEQSRSATVALKDSVTVVVGSVLNVISTSAGLPVRVSNALPQAVTVDVVLRPGDARLRVDDTVQVTVPPGEDRTVQVPVHAIQSADVDVAVELRTPEGTVVDDDAVLTVRVRADWEGIGTAVLGALLALGVVIGLVRTIRRGRTARRGEPQPDSGPDALSPEAGFSPDGDAISGREPPSAQDAASVPHPASAREAPPAREAASAPAPEDRPARGGPPDRPTHVRERR